MVLFGRISAVTQTPLNAWCKFLCLCKNTSVLETETEKQTCIHTYIHKYMINKLKSNNYNGSDNCVEKTKRAKPNKNKKQEQQTNRYYGKDWLTELTWQAKTWFPPTAVCGFYFCPNTDSWRRLNNKPSIAAAQKRCRSMSFICGTQVANCFVEMTIFMVCHKIWCFKLQLNCSFKIWVKKKII